MKLETKGGSLSPTLIWNTEHADDDDDDDDNDDDDDDDDDRIVNCNRFSKTGFDQNVTVV